ncbi:hypothetical protein VNO78_31275 [Psophocarpus tetragonolobus]|uniref:CASP-like protein n=1 Tax=Psophocarpus tetragonolobus TaxID=3891 RepID=A0AAN9RYI7_PSOTE
MAKITRICHILIRFVAFTATFCAAIIMVTSHERGSIFTEPFEAKYTVFPFFDHCLRIFGSLYPRRKLAVATSGGHGFGVVGKKGNRYWEPVCGTVAKYCGKVTGAFIADFIAAIIYIILLLHSIHSALNPLLLKNKLNNV